MYVPLVVSVYLSPCKVLTCRCVCAQLVGSTSDRGLLSGVAEVFQAVALHKEATLHAYAASFPRPQLPMLTGTFLSFVCLSVTAQLNRRFVCPSEVDIREFVTAVLRARIFHAKRFRAVVHDFGVRRRRLAAHLSERRVGHVDQRRQEVMQ